MFFDLEYNYSRRHTKVSAENAVPSKANVITETLFIV